MRPSNEEQETVVNFSRTDNFATVYTSDTRYMNRLDKLCKANPSEWKFRSQETCQGDIVSKTYTCPVNLISFRGKTLRIELTEEQKKERADRLRELRTSQN